MFPVSIRKCTACKCLLYVICECKHFIGKYRSTTSKLCNVLFLLGTFKLSYDGVVLLNIEPTSGVVDPDSLKVVKVAICTDVPRVIKEVIKWVSMADGIQVYTFFKINSKDFTMNLFTMYK